MEGRMFAKRYQYYDYYCVLQPAICGYNFPGFWIFAIHFVVYLTSSILPPFLPVITTVLLYQPALSSVIPLSPSLPRLFSPFSSLILD